MAVAQVLLLAAVLLHRSAAVPACPESCTCQTPALLNCSSSGLTLVPQHIPDSVTELDLSENLLSDSVRIGRRQSRLRSVWLGNSRITRLSLCLERSPGGRYVTGRRRRCVPWAPTLQLLSVERNQLEQLPHGLQSCESLQVLQLSFNRISTLRPQDFDNLRKLKELDLKHNLITSLHPQTFKGLAQLQVLDLSFNMLTSLHPSMYLSLHNIGANVKLAGNSWKCDCSMRSLRRQMGYDGSRGPHAWSVVCASPSKFSGKDLLHLEEDDLNCFTAENSPERHQSVTVFSGSEILLSCSAQDLMGRTPSGQASVNQPEAGLLIKDITERDTGLYVCVSEEQEDVAVFNLQISKVGGAQRKARSLPGSSGQAISQGISNRIGNERNQRATSSQLALAVCLSILFTFLVAFVLGVLARPCIDVLLKRVCKKKSSTATNTVSTVEQSQYDNEAYSEIEEREVSGTHRERRVTFSNAEDGNVQYYDTVANGDQESINDNVFAHETIEEMKNRARDSGSENRSQQSPEDNQGDSRNLSDTTGVIMERRHSSSSDSSLSDREYNQNQITQQNQTRPKSSQLVQDSVQQSANISTAGEAKVSHISIESTHEETGFSSEPFESWSPHPDHTNRTDPDNWQDNEEQFEFSDSARSTPSRSNVIQKRNDTSSSSSYLSENETTHYTVNSDQDEHIHVIDVNRPSVGINHGQPGLGKAHSFSSSSSESEGEDYKTIQGTHKGVGKVKSVALSENRSSSAVTGELVKVPSVGVALSPAAAYSSSSSSESEEENKDLQVKHKHGESQMTKLQFQESQMEGNALEIQRPLSEDIESRWPVLNLEDTSSTRTGLDFKVKSADSDSSSGSDNEDTPGKVVISDLANQKPHTDSRVPDASWPTLDLRHVPKVKRRLDIKVPTPPSSSSNSEDETSNHIKKQWQQQAETARVPITTYQNESHDQGTQWSIKKPSPASDSSSSSDSEDDTTKYIERPGKVVLPELALQKPQTDSRVPDASWPTLDLRHIPKVKRSLDIKVPTPASDSSSSSDSEDESTNQINKKVQQQTEMANYPVSTTQTVILGQGTQWPVKAPSPASHSSSTSSDSEDEKAIHRERPGKVVLPELAIQKPETDSRVPDASWPTLDLRHIPKVKRRLDIKVPTPASDSSSSSDSEDESTSYIKKKVQQQTEMANYPVTTTQTVILGQGTQWPVKAPSPASHSSSMSSDSEDEKVIHRERPGKVVLPELAIQKPQTESRVPDASWPTLDLRHIPKVKRRLDIKVPTPDSDSSSSSESEDESTKHIKKQEQETNMAKLPIKESQTALLDPETQWPLLDLEYTTHTKKRLDFKAKSPAFDTSSSSNSEDDTTKYIERPGKVLLPELAIEKPQTDSRVPDASWPTLDLMHIPKVKRRLDIKAPRPASDSSSSSDSEDEKAIHRERPGEVVISAIQKPQTDSRVPDASWPTLDLMHIPKVKKRLDLKATSPASDSSSSSDSEDEKAIHRERPGKVVISAIQKPHTDSRVPDASWPTLDLMHIPKVKRRLDIKAKTPASDSSSSSESEYESTNQINKKIQQQTGMAKYPITITQTALLDPETQWPLLDLEYTTHTKRRLDFKAKSPAFDTSSSSDSEDDTTKFIERPAKVLLPELAIQKPQTDSRVPDASWPTLDLMHIPKVKRRLDIKAPRPASDSSSSSDSEDESTSYIKKKVQQQTEMANYPVTTTQTVILGQGTQWPVKAPSPASHSSSMSSDSEDEKVIHRERPGKVVLPELAIQKPQTESRVPDASWPTLDLRHIPKVKRRLDIKVPTPDSDSSSSSESEDESTKHIKKQEQETNMAKLPIKESQTALLDPETQWPLLDLEYTTHTKKRLDFKAKSPAFDTSSSSNSEDDTTKYIERPGKVLLPELAIEKPQTDSRVPDASWPTLDLMHIPKVKRRLDIKAPRPASDSSSSSDSEDEKAIHRERPGEVVISAIQKPQTDSRVPDASWPTLDLMHIPKVKKRLDLKATSPASDSSSSSDSEDEKAIHRERPGKVVISAIQKPHTDSRVPDASWPTLDLMHIPKVKRRLDIKAKTPASDSSSSSESEYESTNQINKKIQQQTGMAKYPITITQTALLDPETQWPLLDLEYTTHTKRRLDFKAKSPAFDTSSSSDSEDDTTKFIERPAKVLLPELAIQKPQTDSRVPDASWPTLDLMHIPKVKRRLDIKAPRPASDSSSSSDSEDEKAIHRERPGKVVISAIQKPHTDSRVPDASWPTLDLMHIPKVKRRLDIKAKTPASDSSSSSESEYESTNQINKKIQQQTGMAKYPITITQTVIYGQGTQWPVKAPSPASHSSSSGESEDESTKHIKKKEQQTNMAKLPIKESQTALLDPETQWPLLDLEYTTHTKRRLNFKAKSPAFDTSSSSDSEDDTTKYIERPGKVLLPELAIQKPQTDSRVPDASWPTLDLMHIPKVKRRLDIKATSPASDSSSSSDSEDEKAIHRERSEEVVISAIQKPQTDSRVPDASWPTLDLMHIPKVKRHLDIKAKTPATDSSSSSDSDNESTNQIKKKVQQTEMEITNSQNISQDQGTRWPVKATSPASDSSSSSDSEDEKAIHRERPGEVVISAIQKPQTDSRVPDASWPTLDLMHIPKVKKRLDLKATSPASDSSSSSDSEDEKAIHRERSGEVVIPGLAIQKPQTDSRVPDAGWPTLDLMHIPKVKRRLDLKATSPASDSSSSSDSEDEKAIHRERPGEVVISAIQKPQTDSRVPDASWPTLDLMHIPKVKKRLDLKATSPASDSSSSSDSEDEKAINKERLGEVVISDLAIQKPQTDSRVPDSSWPTLDLRYIPKVKRRLDINAPTPASDSSSSSDSESETMPVVVASAISKTTEKYLIQSPQSPEKTSGNISTMPVINPELESRWATMTLGVSRFRKHLDVRSHAHGASKMPSSPPPVSPASVSSDESGDEGRSSRTRQKRRGTGMQGKILTESTSKVEMTPVTASLSLKSQDRSVGTAEFNERKERPLQSQTSSSSDSENDMVDHSVPDLSSGVPRVKRRLNVKATFPEPRESLSSSSNTEVTGYTATQSRQAFNIPQYRDTDSLITYKRSIFHATSPPSSPPPLSGQTMYDTKQRYSENAQEVPSYSVGDRSASVASKKSLSRSFDDLLNKMVGNSKRITELPPELRWTGVGRQMPERRLDVSVSSPPAEPKLPPPDSSSSESDDEIKQNQRPDITEHKYSSFSAGTVSSSSTRTFDTVDNSSISTNEIVWGASENRQRKGLSALKAISAERQKWDIRQEKSENSASSLFDDYGPNIETSFHYRRTENTKPLSTIPHTQQVHLSSASVDDGGATDWMYGIPSYKRHGIGNNEPPQETPPPIPATPPPSDEDLGLTWRSRPNSWKERSDGTRYSLPKSRNTEETESSSLASENLEVLLDFSNNPITKV